MGTREEVVPAAGMPGFLHVEPGVYLPPGVDPNTIGFGLADDRELIARVAVLDLTSGAERTYPDAIGFDVLG